MWQLVSSHNLNFHKFVRFCHFCISIVCFVLNRDTLEIQDDGNLKHRRWKTDFYFVVFLSCACCWPWCLGNLFPCLKYFPCSTLLFCAALIFFTYFDILWCTITAGSSTLFHGLPIRSWILSFNMPILQFVVIIITEEVLFSPVSICWLVYQMDYQKMWNIHKTCMEDGSWPRIDPVNFWCESR